MKKTDSREFLTFLGFIAPGLLIYLFIIAYPVCYSVFLSFTNYNPNMGDGELKFMGLGNYIKVLTMNKGIVDASTNIPEFWYALKNNMIVVLVSCFGQIPIGFILAFILYRKQVKGANFFQAMVFLPQFLSMVVVGIMWRMLFMVDGPVARIMQYVTGDPSKQFDLMLNPNKAMIPVSIALIWVYTGFYMIIFLANLQKINESIFEAAKIDGATEFQMFYKITIPLLAGSILTSCILAVAGSMKGFALIFALAPEGRQRINAEVLPIYMYRISFNNAKDPMRYAYGATVANIIVLISILLIQFSNWVGAKLGTNEEY
ncbi:MAG: sugar ABC transporter permease [Spirochaetaceae bacterium]|nr:sugar ABC transporter permease [Spirochaetaceae bacterium]